MCTFCIKSISTNELYRKKIQGCYRQFGLCETVRRTIREFTRMFRMSSKHLDISPATEDLAIGAAPKSPGAIVSLRNLGFSHVIDLRAERKPTDILAKTTDLCVHWVPTYDDWKPKPPEFFQELKTEITRILFSSDGGRLFLCCGAGEHRAPLAGVLALVIMDYSLESAAHRVQDVRTVAELLPVYKSSLIKFLSESAAGP